MRAILPVVAIIAALVLGMSLMFPDALRGASDNGTLAALVQCLMVGILVGTGLFNRGDEDRIGLRQGLTYGAIWVGIGLFLVAAYSQRAGFAQLWANITGEVVPSYAQSSGETVTLRKSADGHFWAQVQLNGKTVRMIVDTGATDIALDPDDARRVGIDVDALNFNVPTMTANGPSSAAITSVETVSVGEIALNKATVTVMQSPNGVSLLGMGFLGRLSQVNAQGDFLTLVK
jgi:aspartyl protease family protein